MGSSFRGRFWTRICTYKDVFGGALALLLVLFALSAFSFFLVSRDSAAYLILQLDLAMLSALLVVTLGILVKCRQR